MEEQRGRRVVDTVARSLRAEVPVRPEWRDAVLRDLATLPSHTDAPGASAHLPRRWLLRPLTAVAAGLLCALLGGAATALFLSRTARLTTAPLAESGASIARPTEQAAISVRFVLVAPYASRVSLVGDFNRWSPTAMPMRRSPDGRTWTLDVPLAPGRHVYSFFVDGDLAADPAAPRAGDDDFGVPSSVVLVAGKTT